MMHNEKATSLNVCVCAVSAHRYAQCTRFFIFLLLGQIERETGATTNWWASYE